jgi:hypothetical protein
VKFAHIALGILILATLIAFFAMVNLAFAHSFYDAACCSDRDCEPITFDSVTETRTGYEVSYFSKQGFPVHGFMPREKTRHSQDGRFHGCATSTRFLCLYVPSNV